MTSRGERRFGRAARLALRGLVRKELLQIRNDRRLLPILTLGPIIQLLIFGYAAVLDVATVRVVILDRDMTSESRTLGSTLAAASDFELVREVERDIEVERALDAGDADLAVIVPRGFGRALAGDEHAFVQLVVDGSNSVAASIGVAGAMGVIQRESLRLLTERAARLGEAGANTQPGGLELRPRVYYNPELRSRIFMVPGVLGMILMIITMIATSMALVREKESGTLEQLIVTPISRTTLIAGKLIPFVVIGFIDSLFVIAVAHFWFGVPLEGSLLLLVGNIPSFLLCTLGLGMLVSTISSTQQQAMMTAAFFVLMPMVYLSGFIFPIESMPRLVRPLTEVVPLTHFLIVVRGVMLKGASARELAPAMVKLALLGVGIFSLSVNLFHKRLD
ncbi:MAG: ABC transporter permease [Myxococcota bacterium]